MSFNGDGDGNETMDMQAWTVVQNQMKYNGSSPCPQCGLVINPVEYLHGDGVCMSCKNENTSRRIQGKMV